MEYPVLDISAEAAEDLSNYQYHFVVKDATSGKFRLPDSAAEVPVGVLQNKPTSGLGAVVRVMGMTEVVANAALSIGDEVGFEFVSATDGGKATLATAGLKLGKVHVASGAEDDLASVMLFPPKTTLKSVSVPFSLVANTTNTTAVLAAAGPAVIKRMAVSLYQLPADADGTCLLEVKNYDQSATAEDNLISTANLDMESGGDFTAKEALELTLTSTGADLVLAAGDTVFVNAISDSAAIDTALEGGVITVDYEEY